MDVRALFGLNVLMSFFAFGMVTKLYTWPQLSVMRPEDALIALVYTHFASLGFPFWHPAVGWYALLCASIYEDAKGKCHFTYELPSSLLGQFRTEEV